MTPRDAQHASHMTAHMGPRDRSLKDKFAYILDIYFVCETVRSYILSFASASSANATMGRPIVQVDLTNFEERKHEITKELWSAATDTGFFYLKNTGISEVSGPVLLQSQAPQHVMYSPYITSSLSALCQIMKVLGDVRYRYGLQDEIRRMFSLSKAFFDLSPEVKARYRFDLVSPMHLLITPLQFSSNPAIKPIKQPPVQKKNVGWESGQQKRASHNLPELKESLQLKWHDMDGKWPSDKDIEGFQAFSEVGTVRFSDLGRFSSQFCCQMESPSSSKRASAQYGTQERDNCLSHTQEFMKKCQEVSFKVLSCFALGLGFEEDFFTKVVCLLPALWQLTWCPGNSREWYPSCAESV